MVDWSVGAVSLIRIQNKVNVRIGVLEFVVKQLDVDGAVVRVGGQTYQRTDEPWEYAASRVEQVTAARRAEQQSMVDYLHTTGCRMRFIANLLDDPAADDCGICDNCTGTSDARSLPVELVAEAEAFLRKRPIPLVTKKMYVDPERGSRRKIPDHERVEDGRVLSIWGDGGWGQLVRDGKLRDGRFDERLVQALAELVEEWAPDPAPE